MVGMTSQALSLKASIDGNLKELAEAVDEQAAGEELQRYLDLQARFHRYSWRNCLLISDQRPSASLVAGFHRWKQLGRKVRKGEKAIRIMAPCPVRRENTQTGDEEERLFFKTACVFDVSQTEGKELPEFDVPDVVASAEELLQNLEQVAAKRGIAVGYTTMTNGSYGVSKGGRIEIATGHSTGQQAKSLAHEIAHEVMHREKGGQIDTDVSREIRELEAEAVAYVVCRHFSLNADLRASRYIALWGGDAKKLAASFSRISSTARALIEDVEALAPGMNVFGPGCACIEIVRKSLSHYAYLEAYVSSQLLMFVSALPRTTYDNSGLLLTKTT